MGLVNSPAQMVGLAYNAGKYKGDLPTVQLFLRGIMGGVYIAVGAAFATIAMTGVAPLLGAGMAKLICGAVFPIGLIAIILTGMELFTGDAMLLPMAVWAGKSTYGKLIKNWTFVYLGNLIGSIAFAALMVIAPFTQGNFTAPEPNAFGLMAVTLTIGKILTYKAAGTTGMLSLFFSGIGCNFIVCLAVLMAMTGQDVVSKMAAIWFPIMSFVVIGFEHCVANMYFLPVGKFLIDAFPGLITKLGPDGKAWNALLQTNNGLSWSDIFVWNILPVTVGNIVGAIIVIGATYHYCYKVDVCEVPAPANPAANAQALSAKK
ncbi:formate/nitrite transporter family protein [Sporomusa aerivorans]|uniref:formate/nitrite transporter family protein n=1 Tax=Sporomusa aerivorans TaxID=204936 RepID=UPI00352AB059